MLKRLFKAGLFFIFLWQISPCLAQEKTPFQGVINADNINIRADSTSSAKTLCTLKKDDLVEVVSESYDWYKIRLPKIAPAFIRKNLVGPLTENTAKVAADNVNVRLEPNASSPVIGKAGKEDTVHIIEDAASWYKIDPVRNSFGWIHKKFVHKAPDKPLIAHTTEETVLLPAKIEEAQLKEEKVPEENVFNFTGIVKPYGKVFRQRATHKLITSEKKIILLQAEDKGVLDKLNYRKVNITGKLIGSQKQKYPLIQVTQADVLE